MKKRNGDLRSAGRLGGSLEEAPAVDRHNDEQRDAEDVRNHQNGFHEAIGQDGMARRESRVPGGDLNHHVVHRGHEFRIEERDDAAQEQKRFYEQNRIEPPAAQSENSDHEHDISNAEDGEKRFVGEMWNFDTEEEKRRL